MHPLPTPTSEAAPAAAIGERSAERVLTGLAASPGVAVGPAVVLAAAAAEQRTDLAASPVDEGARLDAALEATRDSLREMHRRAIERVGQEEAAIFEAHLTWLDDPVLLEQLRRRLSEGHGTAEEAVQTVLGAFTSQLEAVEDPLFRARAADLRDVSNQILAALAGRSDQGPTLAVPSVVIARELTPSDTMKLDASRVLAFCTATGGPTAHAAILARSLRIPAVVGLGDAILSVEPGSTVGVDGSTGRVLLAPDAARIAQLTEQRRREDAEALRAREAAQAPAITRDGHRIEVAANIGSPADAQQALEWGAEGVGLLRTEFLYVNRETAPTEDDQLAGYRAIAGALQQRPLVIRTLDIGGDKPVPYLPLDPEANPFLGYRAIRIGLDRPEILKTQLRAILRLGPTANAKVMFPMISDVGELRRAREVLEQARDELRREGQAVAEDVEVGVMIEIPSAALVADQLARVADFFSIGTNDLTQYTLAADRTNSRVAAIYQPLHPAILRLVRRVADAGHERGRWVGMCGELAGSAEAVPLLLGLGLDELSCAASAVPAVKAAVRACDLGACRDLAHDALEAESPEEVRALLRRLDRDEAAA